jgi:hypothetical protein
VPSIEDSTIYSAKAPKKTDVIANAMIYINRFPSKMVMVLENKWIIRNIPINLTLLTIDPIRNSCSKVENKTKGIIEGISYQCPARYFDNGSFDFFSSLQKSIANRDTTKKSKMYMPFC